MKFKLFIYFITILLLVRVGKAQGDSVLTLNKQEWEKTKSEKDYTETFKEIKGDAKNSTQQNTNEESAFGQEFKYVFYFLGFALIILLIILVFKNFKTNVSLNETKIEIQTIDEIEEKIHELDLEKLLLQAMDSKQFKLALRIHFLIIIKQLSNSSKINWAKDKTNWEYYTEIKEKDIAIHFKEVISKFEMCWYGEQPFTEAEYKFIEPVFLSIQNKLGKHG